MTLQKKFNLLAIWLVLLSMFYLVGWTYTWDTATPLGSDAPSTIDDRIREVKAAVQERFNVDHYAPLTGTSLSDTDAGYHRDIHFYSTTATDPVLDFTTVSGIDELRYTDSAGTSKTLTSNGTLNIVSADLLGTLANNTYFTAVDSAGTGTVNLIKANASNVAVIPDGSETATTAAPTADADISNKKYVDDAIAAALPDDDAFGAWASKSNNTSYEAASDGIVCAIGATSSSTVQGYTDSANPPTTKRLEDYGSGGSVYGSITMPVKKGDYWKVTGCGTVYWLPIGG